MMKVMISLLLLMVLSHCSKFALLTSGSSVAISQNAYAKAYSGVDILTIISTDKDIKTHVYENIRKDVE
tara:strand:+ start:1164 stop:1370 length:207 start_codon:yes stop_codon:yes gene_type:complete